jgi:hypothetical protein
MTRRRIASHDGSASARERVDVGKEPRPRQGRGSRRDFLKVIAAGGALPVLAVACSRLSTGTTQPTSVGVTASGESCGLVCVRPREYVGAFPNPLKGFRPDVPSPDGGHGRGLDNPLVTLARHYIRWNEVEDTAGDGVDRILTFCNPRWGGLEKRNIKIIPRVYLYWPDRYYWPSDLRPGDYGSRRFLYRLGKLVTKLGQAWDGDPRIAYVETGIVGPCGEQWNPTSHFELRKVMAETYAAAFPNKLCMIRYPWQWMDCGFGVFWDSWGCRKDTARMLEVLESSELADSWKTRVRGGEIPYGFGDPPGLNPNDTMANPHHIDWVECLTRRGHWNHLGWVAEYDWKRPEAAAHGQRLQKAFGYRFSIEEVSYTAAIKTGEVLEIALSIRNTGSSPFYYSWPFVVSLLDEQTHRCVWEAEFPDVDIRNWLPGDRWLQFANWNTDLGRYVLDEGPARYGVPPIQNRVVGRFRLPPGFRSGRYILALAILDPAGRTPSCRFAIENYFIGGRHPIGRIGVGRSLDSAELDRTMFKDLADDNTLAYQPA